MLAYHLLIPVLCAMVMNGYIYTSNVLKYRATKNWYLPPGYLIGMIWTILFGVLGYIHFLLYSLKNKINYGSISIVLFVLFSLAYPILNEINGYLFNFITLILAFLVGFIVMAYSKHIFLYMIPLLVWVSYVNVIILT